jgi:hypothetical protein
MNKIIVEQENLELVDTDVIFSEIKVNKLILNIKGNVRCGIIKIASDLDVVINLSENSSLNIDFLVNLDTIKNKFVINSKENSKLIFNYACTYKGSNELLIYNNVNSNNTNTTVNIRAVENSGNLNVLAEGIIYENTKDNEYTENIKAITTNNNSIKIMPNLLVKTNSVIANHNATISTVNESYLFYLMSKGIDKNNAIKLIKNGFLKGILKIDELKIGGENFYE